MQAAKRRYVAGDHKGHPLSLAWLLRGPDQAVIGCQQLLHRRLVDASDILKGHYVMLPDEPEQGVHLGGGGALGCSPEVRAAHPVAVEGGKSQTAAGCLDSPA